MGGPKGDGGKGMGKGFKGQKGAPVNYASRGFGSKFKRTVDFNSACVRFLETCMDPNPCPMPIPPDYDFNKDMLPSFATAGTPWQYDNTCCRHAFTCVPKASRAALTAAAWQPDGKRYVTGSNTGELTLWDGKQFFQQENFQAHHTGIRAMTWFEQQMIMMSGDAQGQVKVWDNQYINFHTMQTHKESIRDLAVAPSSLKFATCADESHAKVWDLRSGREERAFTGHGWDVKSIAWHPEKGLVATGSKDSQIKLWDPRVGEAICSVFAHSNMVTKVRFSTGSGDWLVSGARDHLVKVFDLKTMTVRRTFKNHTKEITALAFHPDVHTMFTTASFDGAMYWWDANHEQALAGFGNAHIGSIWSLDYHPMGHLMTSCSHDGSAKMWSRVRPGDDRPESLVQGAIPDPILSQERIVHSGATVVPVQESHGAQPHARVLLNGVFDPNLGKQKNFKIPYLPGAIPGVGAPEPTVDADVTPPGSPARQTSGAADGVLNSAMFEVAESPRAALPTKPSGGGGFDLDFAAAVQQSGATGQTRNDDDATPAHDDDATPANF